MSAGRSLASRGLTPATLIVGGLWVAVVMLALVLERVTHRPVPTCVFKHLTGHPCPTCGSTRAAAALLQGDFFAALACNPLMIALLAGALIFAGANLARAARRQSNSPTARLTWAQAHPGTLAIILLIAVAANWAYVIWHGN